MLTAWTLLRLTRIWAQAVFQWAAYGLHYGVHASTLLEVRTYETAVYHFFFGKERLRLAGCKRHGGPDGAQVGPKGGHNAPNKASKTRPRNQAEFSMRSGAILGPMLAFSGPHAGGESSKGAHWQTKAGNHRRHKTPRGRRWGTSGAERVSERKHRKQDHETRPSFRCSPGTFWDQVWPQVGPRREGGRLRRCTFAAENKTSAATPRRSSYNARNARTEERGFEHRTLCLPQPCTHAHGAGAIQNSIGF